jgi:hypothetical protein
MESIDISYWLTTRDKKQPQNYPSLNPKTLSPSDHESFLRVLARRHASKWHSLFSLIRRKARSRIRRS